MKSAKKIDDIEVLRGFAVLYVVLHHLNGNLYRFPVDSLIGQFYKWFSGGVGVDLFFAISGFVIAQSQLSNYANPLSRQQFKGVAFGFWTRRIFRLLPSAWLWLAIILVLTITYNESGVFGSLKANLEATAAAIFQVANIRCGLGFMRFELGASFIYWSLSLEEQFYLLFPFIALLPRRALVAVLIAAITFQISNSRGIWAMVFRTDAICFGVLIAILADTRIYSRIKATSARRPYLLAIITAVLLVVLAVATGEKLTFSYAYSYVAVISGLLVLIASLNLDLTARIIPLHRMFLWVGARSYAIYLIHIPVFYVVRETLVRLDVKINDAVPVAVVCAGLLIAACAQLNYRYVETPLRRYGATLAQKKFGREVSSENIFSRPIQGKLQAGGTD